MFCNDTYSLFCNIIGEVEATPNTEPSVKQIPAESVANQMPTERAEVGGVSHSVEHMEVLQATI